MVTKSGTTFVLPTYVARLGRCPGLATLRFGSVAKSDGHPKTATPIGALRVAESGWEAEVGAKGMLSAAESGWEPEKATARAD